MFDLSNFTVKILQLGTPGLIASKILSDYGCKVINSLNIKQNNAKIDLLIIDQKTFKKDFKNDNNLNMIVLTENNVSPVHILTQSGLLSVIGQKQTQIFDPKFIVQYMIANSLTILCLQKMLLKNKKEKYKLQISVIDLVSYYGAFLISAKQNKLLDQVKGKNVLDGGAPFYSIYKCKEGNLAVGNLQPKFYQQMVKGLKFEQQINQFLLNNQLNITEWQNIRTILTKKFKQKSAKEWQIQLNQYDTCVTEVRNLNNSISVEPKINWLYKSKL